MLLLKVSACPRSIRVRVAGSLLWLSDATSTLSAGQSTSKSDPHSQGRTIIGERADGGGGPSGATSNSAQRQGRGGWLVGGRGGDERSKERCATSSSAQPLSLQLARAVCALIGRALERAGAGERKGVPRLGGLGFADLERPYFQACC
jgi:hypothetical protein